MKKGQIEEDILPIPGEDNAVRGYPKAHPDDLFEFREREPSVIARERPFSALIPEGYYAERAEASARGAEAGRRREKGRMKAAAIANTLRLLGHGAAINRGAYETPWGANTQVREALAAMKGYDAAHAEELQRLHKLQIDQKEGDRKFNYDVRRDDIADQERARQRDDDDRKYIDARRRKDAEGLAQEERDAAEAAARERARRDNLWIQQRKLAQGDRRLAGSGDDRTRVVNITDPATGRVFEINLDNPDHVSAISAMNHGFMTNVKNKDAIRRWEAEKAPEWEASKNMMNPSRALNADGVGIVMPYIFDAEVASVYGIPYTVDTRRVEQASPERTPAWVNNLNIWNNKITPSGVPQPQQPPIPRSTAPAPPVQTATPPTQPPVAPSRGEEEETPRTGTIPEKERTRLRNTGWVSLSDEGRERKIFAAIEDYSGWDGNKYTNTSVESVNNIATSLQEFYRRNNPDIITVVEEAARRQNTTPHEIFTRVVRRTFDNGYDPSVLVNMSID